MEVRTGPLSFVYFSSYLLPTLCFLMYTIRVHVTDSYPPTYADVSEVLYHAKQSSLSKRNLFGIMKHCKIFAEFMDNGFVGKKCAAGFSEFHNFTTNMGSGPLDNPTPENI